MSIFSAIKDAIFGKKKVDPAVVAKAAAAPAPAPVAAPAAPVAISEIDVEAHLTEMAAGHKLNWQTSIVDLMKLLGMESSLGERKALATELGYTGDMGDSASMNIWLHKAVMKGLAANGGKVPANMID
jgi:hypothetical protein